MCKPAFHEDYQHPFADPVDHHHSTEFDWDELDARLGEAQAELAPRDYAALAEALRLILDWLVDVELDRGECERAVGRRTIALAWAVNPAMFENGPSLTRLADRLGISKATLSTVTAAASRKFTVRNRSQRHGWNWRKPD